MLCSKAKRRLATWENVLREGDDANEHTEEPSDSTERREFEKYKRNKTGSSTRSFNSDNSSAISLKPSRDGLQLGREKGQIYADMALCHLKLQDFYSVLFSCERALDLDPLCQDALVARAAAHEALNNLEGALEDLMLLFMISNSKDSASIKALKRVLASLAEQHATKLFPVSSSVRPSEAPCRDFFSCFSPIPVALLDVHGAPASFRMGIKSLLGAEYDSALMYFQACVEAEPTYDSRSSGNESSPKAVPFINEKPFNTSQEENGRIAFPWRFYLHNYYGTLLLLSGQLEGAKDAFEKAVGCAAGVSLACLAELRIKEALLAFKEGEKEKAMNSATEASSMAPLSPFVAYHKGEILMVIMNASDALLAFDECIKLQSRFLPAYISKAAALLALNHRDQAQELMKHVAMSLFANSPDALIAYGETFLPMCDVFQAEHWFLKALAIDPNSAKALLNLSMLILSNFESATASKLGKAKDYLDRALSINPASVQCNLQLANYYLLVKDTNQSAKHFDFAISRARSFQECVNMIASKEAALMHVKLNSRHFV